jgi:YVTN family beta-propeller protein
MRRMFVSPKIARQTGYLAAGLLGLSLLAVCLPDARQHAGSAAAYAQGTGGPQVYVYNWGDESVSVLDPAQNHQVVATVPVAGSYRYYYAGAAASHDGQRVYLTQFWDDCVSVIDPQTNKVVAQFDSQGEDPFGVAVSPNGHRIYVANYQSGTVAVLDAAQNYQPVAVVKVGYEPRELVVTPDGKRVYVASESTSSVVVIDTATNQVVATVRVENGPGVTISPDGTRVYVANAFSNSISIISTATNKVEKTLRNVATFPTPVVLSPDGSRVYVASGQGNSGSIVVLDATQNYQRVATVKVGQWLNGGRLGITADGNWLYVPNSRDGTVSVINTATNQVETTVKVGSAPEAVVVKP